MESVVVNFHNKNVV